jgi:hypothetical protein
MLYGAAAAVIWGVACGVALAPFWPVALGGVGAAGLAIWLEWEALGGRAKPRRPNFALLLIAAFVFLAILGVGLASLGYFAGEMLHNTCGAHGAGHGC